MRDFTRFYGDQDSGVMMYDISSMPDEELVIDRNRLLECHQEIVNFFMKRKEKKIEHLLIIELLDVLADKLWEENREVY